MLKFCSLYSGSTGNSLFVENNDTKILIDAGVSGKKVVDALESINVKPEEINAILITHEHTDHIQSVGTLSKKYNIPIYANSNTWSKISKEKINKTNIFTFNSFEDFSVGSLKFHPFKIPHDAVDPCGFNVYDGKTKISIATDLGHVTDEIITCLDGSKFILLEANYEPEVLKMCSYPLLLKKRISSSNGHLSNNEAGKTIAKLINNGLSSVMLGHLSKESNFPQMASATVLEELKKANFKKNDIDLSVASRTEPSGLIEIN